MDGNRSIPCDPPDLVAFEVGLDGVVHEVELLRKIRLHREEALGAVCPATPSRYLLPGLRKWERRTRWNSGPDSTR